MVWVAASVIALFGLVGTLITLLTLPGTWLMLLVALVCKLLIPESMGWPWLIAAGVLAVSGEVVEFGASAAGAKVGGAGKPGAIGALLGGLAGGILGTVMLPVPIVGTIVGGVIGAGGLAVLFERWKGGKGWRDSSRAGAGAAAGKLASTFLKSAIAGIMAVVLTVGAFWGAIGTIRSADAISEHSPDQAASGMLAREAEPSADPAASPQDRDVTTDDRPPAGDDELDHDPDG